MPCTQSSWISRRESDSGAARAGGSSKSSCCIATFIYIRAQLTLSSGRTNVLNLRARDPLADYQLPAGSSVGCGYLIAVHIASASNLQKVATPNSLGPYLKPSCAQPYYARRVCCASHMRDRYTLTIDKGTIEK
jgi:hypothetical protein